MLQRKIKVYGNGRLQFWGGDNFNSEKGDINIKKLEQLYWSKTDDCCLVLQSGDLIKGYKVKLKGKKQKILEIVKVVLPHAAIPLSSATEWQKLIIFFVACKIF